MKNLSALLCLIPILTFVSCIVEEEATKDENQYANTSSAQEPTPVSQTGPTSQVGPGNQSSSSSIVDTVEAVSGIKGVVVDEKGFPLTGAIVSITPNSRSSWDAKNELSIIACGALPLARTTVPSAKLQVACIADPLAYDTTDANGQFQFAIGDGDYILRVDYTFWENDIPASFGVIDNAIVTNGKSFYRSLVLDLHPIFCTEEYAPVCGAGITYSNSCFAKKSGLTSWTEGECPPTTEHCAAIDCVQGYFCVEDSIARCVPIDTTPACPKIYAPVCADGLNFDNKCFAEAKGFTVFTEGLCATQRTCYNPEDCNKDEACLLPNIAYCDSDVLANGDVACAMPAPSGVCIALPATPQ